MASRGKPIEHSSSGSGKHIRREKVTDHHNLTFPEPDAIGPVQSDTPDSDDESIHSEDFDEFYFAYKPARAKIGNASRDLNHSDKGVSSSLKGDSGGVTQASASNEGLGNNNAAGGKSLSSSRDCENSASGTGPAAAQEHRDSTKSDDDKSDKASSSNCHYRCGCYSKCLPLGGRNSDHISRLSSPSSSRRYCSCKYSSKHSEPVDYSQEPSISPGSHDPSDRWKTC